ncbi:hypothetical protein AND_001935 [Anopheles darlingi]|uniref:Uncharacterized protein n=1 Tax=Anopheles darlingi TaxID=43151 RepID=W5JTJ2_ANODA|nr:uncharacterized protein LOC125956504 [Anopheles darlingi]ETN66275.1 hypothetical protein AND_001935 [Anopheles darlingi]
MATQNGVTAAAGTTTVAVLPTTGDGPTEPQRIKSKFNPSAKPFVMQRSSKQPVKPSAAPSTKIPNRSGDDGGGGLRAGQQEQEEDEIAYIGPTRLPVSTRVWNAISSYSLEEIGTTCCPSTGTVRPSAGLAMVRKQTAPPPRPPLQPTMVYQLRPLCQVTTPQEVIPSHPFGPTVLSSGIIQLQLRDSVVVDLTLEGSIRVFNGRQNIAIAISSNGIAAAMNHPNGIIFQHGPRVDIMAYDAKRQNSYIRFAKMWSKGISLTSEGCALIYLVDSAGTRTTSDMLNMDLNADYVQQVFYNGIVCGTQQLAALSQVVQSSSFQLGDDSSIQYHVNGFRISQSGDGLVKIYRSNNRCTIRTSPLNGCATVTTPLLHCTASLGATSHLFVRREERRMHFDGATFIVRNAGHSAGFDEHNQLRVY